MEEMTMSQAYDWAKNQNFQSVAARYAKLLADEIEQLRASIKKIEEERDKYRANFLFPNEDDSIEMHGYEFCNGRTEDYRKLHWDAILEHINNLKKQNARLRLSIEQIARMNRAIEGFLKEDANRVFFEGPIDEIKNIAREALEVKNG